MKVLVTGANGFIGRHVVTALLARGHEVRALVRSGAKGTPVPWAVAVDVVRADLSSGATLEGAFDGIECVVHLAAALHGTGAEHRAATVDGTGRLLEAMARTPTRRLVLASSFAVYDWSAVGAVVDERSPLLEPGDLPAQGPYAAAKWEQEHLTRRIAADKGWDLTVLRPGFVWGRGGPQPACLGLALGAAFLAVGPRTRPCLCYVENCADLFATVVAEPRAAGQTFNVVDGDGVSSWRYLRDHLRLAGSRRLALPVPYAVALGGVRLTHGILGPLAPRLPSVLHPSRFNARFRPVEAHPRAARDLLGWTPPWSYPEALRRAYGIADEPAGAGGR